MGILRKMMDSKKKPYSNPSASSEKAEFSNGNHNRTSENLYTETTSDVQVSFADRIVELTINMLEFIRDCDYPLAADNIVLLITGGLLTSIVGYYSLEESAFLEYAAQVNQTLNSNKENQLNSDHYHWMINEYTQRLNESKSDNDAHYDASVMTLLSLTAAALDVREEDKLIPLYKQCKIIFNKLLQYSGSLPEIKSTVQEPSSYPNDSGDALSEVFLQYAYKVVEYCLANDYEGDLTSVYSAISGVFLLLFSLHYEVSEEFISKRIQGLNRILVGLNLNALTESEIIVIRKPLLNCDDIICTSARITLQILEHTNSSTVFFHNRESVLDFCDNSMREMLQYFQKLFTSPNAMKQLKEALNNKLLL